MDEDQVQNDAEQPQVDVEAAETPVEAAPVADSSTTEEPSAAPVPGSAAPGGEPSQEQGDNQKDWYEQLGAVDLSKAPAGAGMPMQQVADMHRRLLEAERRAQQAEQMTQSFRSMFGQPQPQKPQQPQHPKWYNPNAQQNTASGDPELDQFFGQQQSSQFDPGAFYSDWQQQQQQIQQMQQQFQHMQQYIGQMQMQKAIADVSKSYPDVPQESIQLALAQGLDVNAYAASIQAHINKIRQQAMKPQGESRLSVIEGGAAAVPRGS